MRNVQSTASSFGPFTILHTERLLLRSGQPLPLQRESIEILLALVEAAGQPLEEKALSHRAWPERDVALPNIWRHVALLNKVLQAGSDRYFIGHHPKHGYSFVGPGVLEHSSNEAFLDQIKGSRGRLPGSPRVVVGRELAIQGVLTHIKSHRLVSLVGVGGIGKTTVAVAVGERINAQFTDGTSFIDLSSVSLPESLPSAVAASLGLDADLSGNREDPWSSLREYLKGRNMLVVLDNCEHLITASAAMAEQLCSCGVHVLATSREPLRARGEFVFSLQGVEVPPHDAMTPEQALGYGAVQLFVQHAGSGFSAFGLPGERVRDLCEICRRLDGIPLALELAAAWVGDLGVEGLLDRLRDSPFGLENTTTSALDRHHTLLAALDWSHALLSGTEQLVLRRLAVFRAGFPLDSAIHVATDASLTSDQVLDALLGLTDKSLLHSDLGHGAVRYRLLETTRAYAMAKLQGTGEIAEIRRRHAQNCCARLEQAESEWQSLPAHRWIARHRQLIDDVRWGIDWAFSTGLDDALGFQLLAESLPMAGRLSLLREYIGRIRLALARMGDGKHADIEFRLTSALGEFLLQYQGAGNELTAAYARLMELAAHRGEGLDEAVALPGMWAEAHVNADYPLMLQTSQALEARAAKSGIPANDLFAKRGLAYSYHYMGDFTKSFDYARAALAHPMVNVPSSFVLQTLLDREVAMRLVVARNQWIVGLPEQAARTAQECVAHARRDRPVALCVAIAIAACPIAIWRGDIDSARDLVATLTAHSTAHSMGIWVSWAEQFNNVLDRHLSGRAPEGLNQAPTSDMQSDMLATLGGDPPTPRTLSRARDGLINWCGPEVLRAHGTALLSDESSAARGEGLIVESLDLSRKFGARSWELRAATTLAKIHRRNGRPHKARQVLQPVHDQFTEGFDTRDLRHAQELLASLQDD